MTSEPVVCEQVTELVVDLTFLFGPDSALKCWCCLQTGGSSISRDHACVGIGEALVVVVDRHTYHSAFDSVMD